LITPYSANSSGETKVFYVFKLFLLFPPTAGEGAEKPIRRDPLGKRDQFFWEY